jgi:hypothetical protein
MSHCGENEDQLFFVVFDIKGLLLDFTDQDGVTVFIGIAQTRDFWT